LAPQICSKMMLKSPTGHKQISNCNFNRTAMTAHCRLLTGDYELPTVFP
jgi:hypothetical protein